MKRFNVRYAETFLWDMIDITLYGELHESRISTLV
jgi:hypothetical protein